MSSRRVYLGGSFPVLLATPSYSSLHLLGILNSLGFDGAELTPTVRPLPKKGRLFHSFLVAEVGQAL